MRMRWTVVAMVALTAVLGVAVACGGGDEGTPAAGTPAGDSSAGGEATPSSEPTGEASDEGTSDGGTSDDGDGAGGEAPATISEALAARSAVMAENQLAVDAAIQSCMAEQGFEYTPGGLGADVFIAESDAGEFAEQFGYGVTTMTGRSAAELGLGEGLGDDPNQEYLQSLSESQQAAYQRALYGSEGIGTDVVADASGGSAVVTTGGGCIGQANEEVYGEDQPLAFDSDLFSSLQEISAQVEADSRMIAAWDGWAACMAGAGYAYGDEDEIIRDLSARFTAVTGLPSPRSGGGFTLRVGDEPETPDYDEAALAALQDEERRIAAQGASCREQHVDEVEAEVRDEIERAFLAERPEILDALLGPARDR